MSKYYLGIDTSNYKTSIALVDENGNIVLNRSELLEVKLGQKGLRQSDAFFKHCNNLPAYVEGVSRIIDPQDIVAIGVSTRPRRREDSYMPCFMAGYFLAKELGSILHIPVYEFSHQEGHAAAVMMGNDSLNNNKNLFFHLSGGTTEFLTCERDALGYDMQIVGGTRDISIGQLLDRVGVAMGFAFPSGKFLDEIAARGTTEKYFLPGFNSIGGYFNLSGVETKILRWLETRPGKKEIDSMVTELFQKIADLLYNNAAELSGAYETSKIIISGGVASSTTIRKLIASRDVYKNIYFGPTELSGDNAVGIALLAKETD